MLRPSRRDVARWPSVVRLTQSPRWPKNWPTGRSLQAGMIVMTGTLTAITPIESGSTYTQCFSTLGKVEKTFV